MAVVASYRSAATTLLQSYLTSLRGDSSFYLFIAAYAAAVSLVGVSVGEERKMLPLSYYSGALQVLPLLLFAIVVVTGIWAMRSRGSPLRAWQSHLVTAATHIPGALLFLALAVFIGVFSSMKQMLTNIVPFYADRLLADADRFLHGVDPWQLAAAMTPSALVSIVEWVYLATWGPALVAAVAAAVFVPRFRAVRRRVVWTFLLMWTLLGTVSAGVLMSAGPVFYDKVTGDARFAPLMAYLADHTQRSWIYDFLWRCYSGLQPGIVGAGISAFPSMHVSSATLCALLAATVGGWVRWAGFGYCVLILFGSVLLGWHYALDGYFSILATIGIWKLVGLHQRR